MANKLHIILGIAAMTAAFGCNNTRRLPPPAATAPSTFAIKGSVREMVINPESPQFPEHAGRQEFVSYCGICHSLRYISTQPDFPQKTWTAEVKKMVEKYGAPIDSVTCQKIVDYLVAIKGSAG